MKAYFKPATELRRAIKLYEMVKGSQIDFDLTVSDTVQFAADPETMAGVIQALTDIGQPDALLYMDESAHYPYKGSPKDPARRKQSESGTKDSRKYPWIGSYDTTVILFLSPSTGTVISAENSEDIGYFATNWDKLGIKFIPWVGIYELGNLTFTQTK